MNNNNLYFDEVSFPKYLYKYRSGSDFDLKTLEKNKIYAPSFHELNDIFENDFEFELETALNFANIYYPMIIRNQFNEPLYAPVMLFKNNLSPQEQNLRKIEIEKTIKEIREKVFNMGTYCLSEICTSNRMWGLYADSHKGYCIEYKITKENLKNTPRQVGYVNTPPKIDFSLLHEFPLDSILCHMIGHKSAEWEYEKEHRVIYTDGANEYDFPFEIESIIFGERIKNDKQQRIKDIFGDKVKYKKIIKKPSSFELEVSP